MLISLLYGDSLSNGYISLPGRWLRLTVWHHCVKWLLPWEGPSYYIDDLWLATIIIIHELLIASKPIHESSWFCSEIWASKLSGRDLCSLGQLHTAWMALGISRCDQKAEYPGWHTCSMFWMALGICGRVLMHRASSSASSHAQIFCACPMASSENRIGTNGQKKKEGHLIMFNLVAKQPPLPVQIVIFSTRTVSHLRVTGLGFLSDHTFHGWQ